jgi:uncharacterized membrane protein YdfJ with MMPL/SSD domain
MSEESPEKKNTAPMKANRAELDAQSRMVSTAGAVIADEMALVTVVLRCFLIARTVS